MKTRFARTAAAAVIAAGLAGFAPATAHATTARPTTTVSTIKQAAHGAIERRLDWLAVLTGRVNGAGHLTASDRSALLSQLSAASDGLKALDAKIQADTDLATLRADAQTIVTGYRVYVLVTPKVHLVIAADRISWIATRLDAIAGKLQSAIDRAKSKGKDVAAAQAALDDMKAKIAAAEGSAGGVPGEVLPLTAAGYPGNRTILERARASLVSARSDLRSARADAQTVIDALRG